MGDTFGRYIVNSNEEDGSRILNGVLSEEMDVKIYH